MLCHVVAHVDEYCVNGTSLLSHCGGSSCLRRWQCPCLEFGIVQRFYIAGGPTITSDNVSTSFIEELRPSLETFSLGTLDAQSLSKREITMRFQV